MDLFGRDSKENKIRTRQKDKKTKREKKKKTKKKMLVF
jgi:hypothetical protein